MNKVDAAFATQLANIEKRSGKSLAALEKLVKESGLAKHGEVRDMLKTKLKMGHGDANTMAHYALKSGAFAAERQEQSGDVLDGIYAGGKAALRPIHDKLMAAIAKFGPFEISPKKSYVSLRRKKQFAMIGPATNSRIEVGLNMKGEKATARLEKQPAGGMCQYKVKVTDAKEIDAELIAWIKTAFDAAA